MVGMADGYAQACGRPTFVNLHTAPGVGNAMGAIFNAQANKAPLVITAGQQARALITLQANLTNRDATRMPHPLVKWSYEPPRAEDVPHAIARATHVATLPPQGPVFVSIPMDDWAVEVDEEAVEHEIGAPSSAGARRGPPDRRARASALASARNPVMVAGPDIDASGAWDAAVALAETAELPVWATPAPGRRPDRLPGGPPALPRHPAAGDRPAARDARRPRPDPRRRRVGVPLLPEHPRAAAARGRALVADHERPGRGGARADGRRDRRRREAHARGARRARSPASDRDAPQPRGPPAEARADRTR